MLQSKDMCMKNEWCLAIPLAIFSPCPNKKHIYKYSCALPGVHDNSIHFGQSICSVCTHRLQWGTKGPLWLLAGENHRHSLGGLVPLAELHHWALSKLGRVGVWKVKNTLIWCHVLFKRAPSVSVQVNERGQLRRKHCDRRRCEKVDEARFLLSRPC